MKQIKEENQQFINNLLLELIHYYMKSIGQSINKDEQMVNITLTELSKYIFKHHLSYTMQEIREAFTYGRNNDQTQGGAIYAQRMIFWLKNYHQEVWLKKNKTAIHNGTFNKPLPESKRVGTSRNVSLEFIKDQQKKYHNGEVTMLIACYDYLKSKGHFDWFYQNKKRQWEFVSKACESLLEPFNESSALTNIERSLRQQIKNEIEKIQIGNWKTVSNRINAEVQRLMVADVFDFEDF
jgi:hypothetical protein